MPVTVHEVRERQLLNVVVRVVKAEKLHGPNFLKVWQFIKAAPAVVHNGRLQRDISTSCNAMQFSNILAIVVTFAVFQLRTFILVKERHPEKSEAKVVQFAVFQLDTSIFVRPPQR
jgi:hypothetical protein